MTNEEMIFCVLKEHTKTDKEQLAMLAELKDKQYKEREDGLREIIDALDARLQRANESGMFYFDQCNIQKGQLIDKACEWLRNNMYEGTCEQILSKKPYPFMSDFINEFKQAMKERCENALQDYKRASGALNKLETKKK